MYGLITTICSLFILHIHWSAAAKYGDFGGGSGGGGYSYAPGPPAEPSYGGSDGGGAGGGGGNYGYATGGDNGYTGVQAPPSKYPPAMTHERNRPQTGYALTGSAKKFQERFEGLFDDFPGPKTKQRVYYPGRGYVTMQVPVQQPDPYNKGGSSYSGSSSYSSMGNDDYSSPPSYGPPPSYGGSRPSYSAPAPYSQGSANEDDDSPFGYMVKKGGASSYSPSPSSYSPPSYRPPSSPPAYSPPKPYGSQSSGGFGGGGYGNGGGGGGGGSDYNPSGYKPSSYPSSYPDSKYGSDGDSSSNYPSRSANADAGYNTHDHDFYGPAEAPNY